MLDSGPPAVLQIKPEQISVRMREDGSGVVLYSDCLRQHHAGNSMLYPEHNKHRKVKGLIPSHPLKSSFVFQVQFSSFQRDGLAIQLLDCKHWLQR